MAAAHTQGQSGRQSGSAPLGPPRLQTSNQVENSGTGGSLPVPALNLDGPSAPWAARSPAHRTRRHTPSRDPPGLEERVEEQSGGHGRQAVITALWCGLSAPTPGPSEPGRTHRHMCARHEDIPETRVQPTYRHTFSPGVDLHAQIHAHSTPRHTAANMHAPCTHVFSRHTHAETCADTQGQGCQTHVGT